MSPEPAIGSVWRSRDRRDNGLRVTVLDVANGYVRIQRFRKTTVSLKRFTREYEPLEGAALPDKQATASAKQTKRESQSV